MGCAASKAPPKRDPVEELIEEVHAQQGRESGGGVTLDLSAAPATPDAPAGKLAELGLSLNGKVPDAAWACVGVTTLSLKGNHLGSLSPKLAQLSALRVLDGGAARVRHPPRPHGDRVQQLLARAPAPIQGAPGGAPGARVPDRAPEPY